MATAQSLITRALRLIQVVGSGVAPEPNDLADGLAALNAMLDGWRTQPHAAWVVNEVSCSLVSGQSSYTIGTGGNINAARPVRIENARCVIGGSVYQLAILTQAQWAGRDQTQTGTPDAIYPAGAYPLMTLHLSPSPSASGSLVVGVLNPFAAFSALGDTAAFPPGYEECVAYQLAVRLAPEYGVSVSSEVATIARESLANIKRMNYQPPSAHNELADVFCQSNFDILNG